MNPTDLRALADSLSLRGMNKSVAQLRAAADAWEQELEALRKEYKEIQYANENYRKANISLALKGDGVMRSKGKLKQELEAMRPVVEAAKKPQRFTAIERNGEYGHIEVVKDLCKLCWQDWYAGDYPRHADDCPLVKGGFVDGHKA